MAPTRAPLRLRPTLVRAVLAALASLTACGEGGTGPAEVAELTRLAIDPVWAAVAGPGDSVVFSAVGVLSDGTRAPVSVSWHVGDPAVATIDAHGTARGVSTGVTTVRAQAGPVVGFAAFAVDPDTVPPALETVGVDQTRVDVLGGPALVRLTARFSDDRSGVTGALAHFDGPLGPGITGLVVLALVEEDGPFASFDGLLEVPSNSGIGIWTLSVLRANDAFGNVSQWGAEELARRGLTVRFEAVAGSGSR